MVVEHRGELLAHGMRFAIVASRTNAVITERLCEGAIDGLERHGADRAAIEITWVPGAFEIPLIAARLAQSGRFQAVIAIGAVIRGGTSHYELVSQAVSRGVIDAALQSGVPVIFGVVTAETLEQAVDRAGGKAGNRGFEAAQAAIEMANLLAAEASGRGARTRARTATPARRRRGG
ncbi:MAG TPA: 6,7-dimethyl-8-ribityllumazine synthase [Candidatus Udaeobacter sp.]|nr:6,7-dimethyl-8-ribityllumazine synthase [Candidatus Udaeobacter sp.]